MTKERLSTVPKKLLFSCDSSSLGAITEHDICHKSESELWCLFIRDRRWSMRQKRLLLDFFDGVSCILNASHSDVFDVIQSKPKHLNSEVNEQLIVADLDWLSLANNYIISIDSELYPSSLLELPDPPIALFASGDIRLLSEPQVAIVGSRRPTPIGVKIVRDISAGLARLGLVVNSGMALGIDGLAHQAALEVGGATIAIMGCGLDVVYPIRNAGLHAMIHAKGLLLSEFPLGTSPTKYTFPMRNRIVSGLSYGVVIVEAAPNSGTLITASFASEQNKEVMVVPGSALSRQYAGSHELIKNGAALVDCYEDVLHCLASPLQDVLLNSPQAKQRVSSSLDAIDSSASHLLNFIGAESTSMDAIILASGLTTAEVSSILLELELNGLLAMANDGGYVNLS